MSRELVGTVVSVSSKDTVVVEITRIWQHPIYKKSMKRSKRMKAHVEGIEVSIGDRVRIQPIRPMSKTKHYKVIGRV